MRPYMWKFNAYVWTFCAVGWFWITYQTYEYTGLRPLIVACLCGLVAAYSISRANEQAD